MIEMSAHAESTVGHKAGRRARGRTLRRGKLPSSPGLCLSLVFLTVAELLSAPVPKARFT